MEKHFTATVYLLKDDQVLLLFHPKLKKWLPPGGHIEKNESPPMAARREVLEETGLEFTFIHQENIWIDRWNAKSFERPYLCLMEEIPEHKGVPAHQHMDLIYLGKPIGNKAPVSRGYRHEIVNKEGFPMREAQGARWKEPQGGLLKQGDDEISHRKNLRIDNLMTTPSKAPIRWFTLEDAQMLKDDDEIFVETKEVLQTILPVGTFR